MIFVGEPASEAPGDHKEDADAAADALQKLSVAADDGEKGT